MSSGVESWGVPNAFPPPMDGYGGQNRYTETTYQGYGSRVKNSLGGACLGIVLFFLAFPLLWWNESSSVAVQQALDEVLMQVTEISGDKVDSTLERKLVCVTGRMLTAELEDAELGFTAEGVRLKRVSEVYQWHEHSRQHTKKTAGGGQQTTTTYDYSTNWYESLQDSDRFHHRQHPPNPRVKALQSRTFTAENVKLEAFRLPKALVESLGGGHRVAPSQDQLGAYRRDGDMFYSGNAHSPRVGDLRFYYEVVPAGDATVVAVQRGDTFTPYRTKGKRSIQLLYRGLLSAEEVIDAEKSTNTMMTWAIRAGGFMLMWIGLGMLVAPLSMVLDWVPFVGSLFNWIVSTTTSIATFLIALVCSCVTIALAWLWCRPMFTLTLLGGAGAIMFFCYSQAAKKKKEN